MRMLKKWAEKTAKLLPLAVAQRMDARVHAFQSRLLPQPTLEAIDVAAAAVVPGRLLVATATGLIICENGTAFRILPGFFFGLTYCGGRWFAFRKISRVSGQIISFILDGLDVRALRCEVDGLSPRIHQIDAFDEKLFVMDTYNNRVLVYDLSESMLGRPTRIYPAGRASSRHHPNYVHMNSVFVTEDRLHLMYHNLSRDTGRGSRVVILNHECEVLDTLHLDARCAHNIAFWDGKMIYCASEDSALHVGVCRLQVGDWSRGIALFEDVCVVGGSQRAKREERERGDGYLYHCDLRVSRVVSSAIMRNVGSVYEVRSIDPPDLSLSENARRAGIGYPKKAVA